MTPKNLYETFNKVYGKSAERTFFAPGRINLIGEHIDYNGGLVFPCAISQGTYALVSKRTDRNVNFYSMNFEELGIIESNLDNIEYLTEDDWANYPKGVLKYVQEDYTLDHGFDVLYFGNIPNGAGLSSSASIDVVTTVMVNNMFSLDIPQIDIVHNTRRVENEFMGVNTGIMDQYAITFGRKDSALLLDTQKAEHRLVPIKLKDMSIVIMNTNKVRGLTDSKYNQRLEECQRALKILQEFYDIQDLCELNQGQLEVKREAFLEDQIAYNRAFHAITENERVKQAVKVLEAGDIKAFGDLMYLSHESLKTDYEVTGVELDTLVDAAKKSEYCLGARVTGAGFGGCAIAIVEDKGLDAFIESVGLEYKEIIGYDASFYQAHVGDGAHEIIS
ncbi:galactokinase [Erysipelothrix sp. HDW6A]|uniref:galactokinase n=1 Tax=Erysipelothrix sp. HDW6A TaxID=2714928 RepID=UPI0014078D90|nr:galactokinase [Erysipelothrix sp. HDW6A]QIK56724.1 galactokinase [Erysipelothrix sp. HDW6A]